MVHLSRSRVSATWPWADAVCFAIWPEPMLHAEPRGYRSLLQGYLVVRGVLMVPSVIVSECTARGAVHGDGPSSNHKPIRLCAFMNGSRSLLRNNPTVAVIIQPSFRLTHVDIVSMVQLKWGGKENRWSIHWVYWPFTSKR